MSRSDDETKLMPTPASTAGGADDRTRVMPAPGADDATKATPPPGPSAPADSGDATRAVPVGGEPPPSASDDRTPLLDTSTPDDATAIIGAGPDDPTMALAAGGAATLASEMLDDDVTIVRPQARRRPRLLLKSPAGETEEHALDQGEVTVGRASGCTLVLANPEVSRKHARIVTGPTGSVLHTEGARHNTTVNGEPVEGERALQHGDVLELASERLVFAESADTPSFDDEPSAAGVAAAPRSFALPIVGAVAVVAIGFAAYLLGSRQPLPPPPPQQAAAPVAAAAPAIDPREQAAAATEAAREAATKAVREVAEREAAAARIASRDERIAKLLYEGDIALLENRLTTPPNGSAFYAYSETLKIDPDNEQAKTKIVEILEKYLGWAEAAKAAGNRTRARLYADKAAYIRAQTPSVGDGAAIDARISALGGGTR